MTLCTKKPRVCGSRIKSLEYNFGGEYICVYGTLGIMNSYIFMKHRTEKNKKKAQNIQIDSMEP